MRLYAGIISYIAMVSLAANVGIGYYLYTYEQTNQRLQNQIIALQQTRAADADQLRELQKTIIIKEQLLTYTRAQLPDAPRTTTPKRAQTSHIDMALCPQQLDAQQIQDAQTPTQLQRIIQAWYSRTTLDTLADVQVQRRTSRDSADFQMVLFLTKKSDKTPYQEIITVKYINHINSTNNTHPFPPVHMIMSTTCLLYGATP